MNVLRYILLFVWIPCFSQTQLTSLTIQKDLRVQGEAIFGGVNKPVAGDMFVFYDSIYIPNLFGTGNIVTLNPAGYFELGTGTGTGGVTGLNQYQLVFGSPTGTIDQTPNLQWSDAFLSDILYITGTNPLIDIRDPANSLVANYSNIGVFLTDGSGAAMDIQYNMLKFVDDDNGSVSIFKKDDNSGTVYDLYLPPVNGTSGKSLRLNGSLELEWYTPAAGTVTSFSATDGNGFDFTVTNPTTTPTLSLTTTVTDNQVMVSNSGAISGSSLFTYDNTANNEHFDVTVLEFDVVGTSTYPFSLFNISDNGNVSICDFNGNFNGTYAIFDDPSEAITLSANNGITVNQFSGLGENLVYSNNLGTLGLATLSDFTLSAGALSIAAGAIVNADINASAAIDATKIGGGGVTTTEFDYLGGVTSDVQTQLDARSKVVATSHLTGQNAAIAATTLYAVPVDGFYTITVQLAVTTTGGTSIGTQIRFTNVADNVVKTMPSNNNNGLNQCASSTTANAVCYTITAYCKSGTNIQYITNLAGSGQVYSLDAQVVKD